MTRYAGQSVQRSNNRLHFGRENYTARTPSSHLALLSLTNRIDRGPLFDQARSSAPWCDSHLLGPVFACIGHTHQRKKR